MAANLRPGASADEILEEITFLETVLATLPPDALDYEQELGRNTQQLAELHRALDAVTHPNGASSTSTYASLSQTPSTPHLNNNINRSSDVTMDSQYYSPPSFNSLKRRTENPIYPNLEAKSRRTTPSPNVSNPTSPEPTDYLHPNFGNRDNRRRSNGTTSSNGALFSQARQQDLWTKATQRDRQISRDRELAQMLAQQSDYANLPSGQNHYSGFGEFGGGPVDNPYMPGPSQTSNSHQTSQVMPPPSTMNFPTQSFRDSPIQQLSTGAQVSSMTTPSTDWNWPSNTSWANASQSQMDGMPGTWPGMNGSSADTHMGQTATIPHRPSPSRPSSLQNSQNSWSDQAPLPSGCMIGSEYFPLNSDPFAEFDRTYENQWSNSFAQNHGARPHTQQMPGSYGASSGMTYRPSGGTGLFGDPFDVDGYGNIAPTLDNMPYRDNYHYDPAQEREQLQKLLDNISLDNMNLPKEQRPDTPGALRIQLLEHQKIGLAWLLKMEEGNSRGGILADDMGLGKTIQALALIVSRPSQNPRRKTTLIVAPVALMVQWEEEIRTKVRSRYSLDVYVYHGPRKGKLTFQDLSKYDVVLTTYGTLAAEGKKKEKWASAKKDNPNATQSAALRCYLIEDDCKWYRVILDESQCIRNKNTNTAKAAYQLKAKAKWCLTGTPMMNGIQEIFSPIHFIGIKPYNDWSTFRRDFGQARTVGGQAMEKMQALLKSILLRRLKTAELDGAPILNLPERNVNHDHPRFSEEELDFYDALEKKSQLKFSKYVEAGTVTKNYTNALLLLLRLRQACDHPHLIQDLSTANPTRVSVDVMVDWAKKLDQNTIARIKSTDGGFECPICMDAAPNPAIFFPCGHDTCAECYSTLAERAAAGHDYGDGDTVVKCPECRGPIDPKKVFDYETFKKVHLPEEVVQKDEGSGSDDSDTDSDDESDSEGSSLGGFIAQDDEEIEEKPDTKEPTLAAENGESSKKATSKGKAKSDGEKTAEKKKKKKEKKGNPAQTLAALKREGQRNKQAKKKYLKRLKRMYKSSCKIDRTIQLLQEIDENDPSEKTIIFSQFTSFLDLLEVPMQELPWKYERYDGSMKAEERADAVKHFRRDPACKTMLVSLKAGNAGLNLTAASQVIILDPFWNPYIEEQAIDRTHRIGQNRAVNVHRILIEDTVEDRIIALQEKKRETISTALDENSTSNVSRLGPQELAYLFGLRSMPQANGA